MATGSVQNQSANGLLLVILAFTWIQVFHTPGLLVWGKKTWRRECATADHLNRIGSGRKLVTRKLKDPSTAKEIREKLELSQDAFASLMGVSVRTVQDWEQGRRQPQGPAKSLLRVAEQHPEVFSDLR